jgi:LysR family glycine cleavage system transcriptional activator
VSLAQLPPLHFLRAVEAAARLGSFRAAAAELHLTPSAISQQIRTIEQTLGARLFIRSGRAVVLTAEGRLYCQDVRRALHDLVDAGRRLASRSSGKVLRLSTVDFLAHEFLIPRLPAFQERFPGVELRIETSMRVVELHASEIDAALRVRGKAGPALSSVTIGPVFATPVTSPSRASKIRRAEDLVRETLIEMRGSTDGAWVSALRAWKVRETPQRILSFESYFETITAAERGLGVTFGLFPMTADWVLRGRLAVPLPVRAPIEGGVYLVFRPDDPRRALLTDIGGWLASEYDGLDPLPAGRIVPSARRKRSSRTSWTGREAPSPRPCDATGSAPTGVEPPRRSR